MTGDDDAWFVRSAAGLSCWPIRWPGWALVIGFIVAVMGLPAVIPRLPWVYAGIVGVLTLGLLVVVVRTSRPA